MSVVIETTLGDITVDLFLKERPRACLNFLKLCKIKYYNYSLFHTVSRNFIAQTGDPTGSRNGGESIFGVLEGPLKRYFEAERNPRIKHTNMGLISFVGNDEGMIGSQFFLTLGTDLTYLDEVHCVFGEVVEGLDVLEILNEAICDGDNRPYQDIRITHTVILDDPFPNPQQLRIPERSPSPSAERLQGGRIAPDEEIDETEGKCAQEIQEIIAEREEKARATILEMVGDIPDAEMAPPENVLFVCKLNPVTTDDDLEIIFSRFGKIKTCEIIRDKKTGDSLQYAFVEFEEEKSCEDAYFKMDNVLIDDRRIHVDFSQSVAKVKWHGKGRGVTTYDEKGKKTSDFKNDIGNGRYTAQKNNSQDKKPFKKDYENGGGKRNNKNTNNKNDNEERERRNYSNDGNRQSNTDRYSKNDRNRDRNDKNQRNYDNRNNDRYEDTRKRNSNDSRSDHRESRSKYYDSRSRRDDSRSNFEGSRSRRQEPRSRNMERNCDRYNRRYEERSRENYNRSNDKFVDRRRDQQRNVDKHSEDRNNRKNESSSRKKNYEENSSDEDRKKKNKKRTESDSSEDSEPAVKKSKKQDKKQSLKKKRSKSSSSEESSDESSDYDKKKTRKNKSDKKYKNKSSADSDSDKDRKQKKSKKAKKSKKNKQRSSSSESSSD